MPRKPKVEKHKGVFEKVRGSGIWWIRYTRDGRRVSESIGRHGDAVTIYQQRMTEIRVGISLSLKVGKRGIKFGEVVVDALQYSKDHHRDTKNFKQRLELAEEEFGVRKSEQFTVELGRVDFEHEYIYLQMTKNGSERYVHLNHTALNTLGSLKEERDRRGLKFPTLFFDKQNSPIKDPREWFAVTCKEAGIEGVTWHILRHVLFKVGNGRS
jgi:integrase